MTSMTVRTGTERDVDALERLYDELNDSLAAGTNYPGWKKGVYPTREDAEKGVAERSLFVAAEGEEIVGSLILRHEQEPAYLTVKWQEELSDDELFVIYTFVVSPRRTRQGVGRLMLDFAAEYASRKGARALRLDVYEKNAPAKALYESCGFKYIDSVSLGLEKYGLDSFDLYEQLLV